jgi:hypothetical protein
MTAELLAALVTVIGTALAAFLGVVASASLTNFRLKKLEDKVDAHNQLIERMAICENKISNLEHKGTHDCIY